MSILATSRPTRDRHANEKVCPRCGVEWTDNGYRFVKGAPCADCRSWLVKHEGADRNEWYRKPKKAAA